MTKIIIKLRHQVTMAIEKEITQQRTRMAQMGKATATWEPMNRLDIEESVAIRLNLSTAEPAVMVQMSILCL